MRLFSWSGLELGREPVLGTVLIRWPTGPQSHLIIPKWRVKVDFDSLDVSLRRSDYALLQNIISYNIGERNTVSASELKDAVSGIKSLDDNTATMDRTVEHLESNGVDLSKYPVALGPHLQFDPKTEKFSNNDKANEMLTREYRSGF